MTRLRRRLRRHLQRLVAASLVLAATCMVGGESRAQSLIAAPGTSGDQLLFFYDATPGRTLFLVVANISQGALTLQIDWYSQELTSRLATQTQELASGANVILDPTQVQGVSGKAGLTVVTPIVSVTDTRPIVPSVFGDSLPTAPSGSLIGGFTLADTSANSAFGQNPLARVAVDAAGNRAPAGAIVDGTTILYQRIAPDALFIPFYFNPARGTLTNRAFVAAFEDRYTASGFDIGPVSLDLGAALLDASGDNFANGNLAVNGVAFTDLQTLAGGTPFTSSGKVLLAVNKTLPANANLLGLMSQSLGTFAVGQGMPGYFNDRGQGDRFVENGDGTVTDRQTGLQWEQKTSGGSPGDVHDVDNEYTWTASEGADGTVFSSFLAALNHGVTGVGNCVDDGDTESGGFAGHCDWRLPTISELRTIVDTTVPGCGSGTACINPIFGPTQVTAPPPPLYWSATRSAANPLFVLTANFSDGALPTLLGNASRFARAVRGGK